MRNAWFPHRKKGYLWLKVYYYNNKIIALPRHWIFLSYNLPQIVFLRAFKMIEDESYVLQKDLGGIVNVIDPKIHIL